MLVIDRKVDQAVHIGADITVTVVSVSGNHVKLAIDAPKTLTVLRAELVDKFPLDVHAHDCDCAACRKPV